MQLQTNEDALSLAKADTFSGIHQHEKIRVHLDAISSACKSYSNDQKLYPHARLGQATNAVVSKHMPKSPLQLYL